MVNLLKKNVDILINRIIKLNKRRQPVYLSIPDIYPNDIASICSELKKNNVAIGNSSEKFRLGLKNIIGSNNLLLTSNGTVALYAALKASKIDKDDEVLVPTLNYIASTNAIISCNGTPHFIDSSLEDLSVDFEKIENYLKKKTVKKKKITINKFSKKKLRALMITHVFGHACNMDKAMKICKKYNLILIEDASEALGTKYKKKHVGTFGDYGVISFNGNKIITTGGGGLLIVKKKENFQKLKKIINNGKIHNQFDFLHSEVGLNLNLPNLNASLGYSQLKRLKIKIKDRRNLYKIYSKHNNEKFKFINEPKNSKSNFWLQALRLDNKKEKNFLISQLYKNRIEVRSIWKPNHLFSYLNKYPKMNLDNSIKLYNTIINIPSSIKLNGKS